ncbi:MAG: helix-turn-helix domain-containing protein [Bacillota bacterium]
MNIGQKLKSVREQQNISMNALAKRADVSQSTLSRIESGQQMPTFDVLERLITALGLTLVEFFSDQAPELSPDIRQMLDVAQKLTPLQRKLVTSVMKEMAKNNQMNETDVQIAHHVTVSREKEKKSKRKGKKQE